MLGAHIEVVLEIIVGGSDVGHTFELQDDEHAQLLHGLFSSASKARPKTDSLATISVADR